MINKEEIKKQVVKEVNKHLETIEKRIDFPDGTSIGETQTMYYKYDIGEAFDLCFNLTFDKVKEANKQ